eukprot:COSAG01_NODE_12189_length_1783_cov_1.784442_1_plen_173_part_00
MSGQAQQRMPMQSLDPLLQGQASTKKHAAGSLGADLEAALAGKVQGEHELVGQLEAAAAAEAASAARSSSRLEKAKKKKQKQRDKKKKVEEEKRKRAEEQAARRLAEEEVTCSSHLGTLECVGGASGALTSRLVCARHAKRSARPSRCLILCCGSSPRRCKMCCVGGVPALL